MIICGVDVETTGLSSTTDKITELGAVLYCTETNKPMSIFNELVNIPEEIKIKPIITELTGITREMLSKYGSPIRDTLSRFYEFSAHASHFVAHNAPFDRGFIENAYKQVEKPVPEKPWIDTLADVPYPERTKSRQLGHLAADHNFLNPFAHRAVFDVLTMLRVLSNYDFEMIANRAGMPSVELKAMVTFENKELAKARGFRWYGKSKSWIKTVKENEVELEQKNCDFRTAIIK